MRRLGIRSFRLLMEVVEGGAVPVDVSVYRFKGGIGAYV